MTRPVGDINLLPRWYRQTVQGEKQCLPQSHGQGVTETRVTWGPLQAQIAVFFGELHADPLDLLQRGAQALSRGEVINCDVCRADVWKQGHAEDCSLVQQYVETIKTAGEIERRDKQERLARREARKQQMQEACRTDRDKMAENARYAEQVRQAREAGFIQ